MRGRAAGGNARPDGEVAFNRLGCMYRPSGCLRTMKLFECQNCGQPLYFENTKCESCGLRLGYLPKQEVITALEAADGVWSALAAQGEHYRFCANAEHDVCNW